MPHHIHISYSDTDRESLDTLAKYLDTFAPVFGYTFWSRANLESGELKQQQIQHSVSNADAIIFLVTIDLYAEKDEVELDFELAMGHVDAGRALAVPILLRSMPAFDRLPLSKYPLPTGVGPMDLEPNPAQAWKIVVEWIFQVFEKLGQREVYRSFLEEDRSRFIDLANEVNILWEKRLS